MLKKFILAGIAFIFILVGSLILIMGYVFTNPDSVFTALDRISEKFMQGQTYEEKGEFFLQGVDELLITSRNVEIQLLHHDGPTLKVLLSGEIPKFESGPYLIQELEQNSLHLQLNEPLTGQWLQMNINGEEKTQVSTTKLIAKVYLPDGYHGNIQIHTKGAPVSARLPTNSVFELDLESQFGKIENQANQEVNIATSDKVGTLKIKTESGNIKIEVD